MMIVSLKQHFPARAPEWFMSGLAFVWGANILLHQDMFVRPETASLLSGLSWMANSVGYKAAPFWGLICVTTGLIRASALFINGAYTRTPMVRLVLSFSSAFIWTQVTIALIISGVPNTGWPLYAGCVVLDIISAYRAGGDVVYAEQVRRDLKRGLDSRAYYSTQRA